MPRYSILSFVPVVHAGFVDGRRLICLPQSTILGVVVRWLFGINNSDGQWFTAL
jgi:hypothetical protein